MSQVHLHLLITHLPVFGPLLGAIVLGYGLWSNNNQTKYAAYFLFIISTIGASIAYITGEGAEEVAEKIQGVSENRIELHEDAAMYALISLIALGLLSVTAIIASRYKTSLTRTTSILIFILSLISFGLAARTGYLGGKIRHTEISSGQAQYNSGGEAVNKGED